MPWHSLALGRHDLWQQFGWASPALLQRLAALAKAEK
jgi:hypothetical protein